MGDVQAAVGRVLSDPLPLEDHLRGLEVDTLAFCGANFPNCPRTSIYEASERDFRIVLAPDAVSGVYDRGRAELEGIGVALMEGGPRGGRPEARAREGAAAG